jgi:rhamnosyl/mannosyltransferase
MHADVVHVYKDFPPVRGGIEGHIDLLTRALAVLGVRSEVLCRRPSGVPGRETRDGVEVRRCRAPITLASTPLPPALPLALRRSRAPLVHLHQPWPPGDLAWALGGNGRKLVVTFHCEAVRYPLLAGLTRPLTDRTLAAAGGILVTSAAMRRVPALLRHGDRIRVVPYGVDLERFRPATGAADLLPEISRPRIVFVGRLRYYKGLPALAAALASLPAARLVVAGDGPERGTLERALRDQGCRDRAHLLGEVDDDMLVRVLQAADVAALPSTSRAEAFGIAVAEAQACGVPAVVTDVGTGTTCTVADGVSGRVVAPGDSAALAAALRWCLDPSRHTELKHAARRHAEASFSAAAMARAVRDLYAEVREG